MAPDSALTEEIAWELKRAVGRGLDDTRARQARRLRELIGRGLPTGATDAVLTAALIKEVGAAVASMDQDVECFGRLIPSACVREAYELLLALTRRAQKLGRAPNRRTAAIDALGLAAEVAIESWRRSGPPHPEVVFMRLLAGCLVERNAAGVPPRYRIETATQTYYVNEAGAITRFEATICGTALVDGLELLESTAKYPGLHQPGVFSPGAFVGCELVSLAEPNPDDSLVALKLRLVPIPRRNHPYSFGYSLNIAAEQPPKPRFLGRQFQFEAVEWTFQLIFPEHARPEYVWWFECVTEDLLDFELDLSKLVPADHGVYRKTVSRPTLRYLYGLMWK